MLLEAEGICKNYRGVHALEDVDFTLSEGECLGLVGPNGAGKSTLLHILSGFVPPSSGEVVFRGQRVTRHKPHVRVRLGMGRTFQVVEPIVGMTCLESVMVAGHVRHPRRAAATKAAAEVLEFVGLGPETHTPVESMSLAQHRLLEFARVLALEPAAMLLDEPMSGLTLAERRRVAETVRELRGRGVGVVLVEHDMPIIVDLCDRVVVLDQGRRIADGTLAEVGRMANVRTAYLGAAGSAAFSGEAS